jgi:hypothetical protein
MRRILGFKLTTQGRHLMSFVCFCEEHGAEGVTADLALEWATRTTRGSGDEVYQARRLDVVRIFARACHVFRVSHGMANTVILSQGKPSGEEDSQSIQRASSDGKCPRFLVILRSWKLMDSIAFVVYTIRRNSAG